MRKKIKVEDNNTFFMSIGDLMTGLLFIFILLFLKEHLTSNKEEYKKILKEYSILKEENLKQKEKLADYNILKEENEKYKRQDRKIEEIFQKIENKLKEAIKDDPYVKIDTVKQELILDNSVLFDSGEWKLKEKGKRL